MDVTFEDVAMVIQDARFQQAIVDVDAAQPDKQIKVPRSFDPDKFIEDANITLKNFVHEPLGRWFLEKFADVKDTGGGMMFRDVNGPTHKCLKGIEDAAELKKRDPASLLHMADLVRILERYGMEDLFNRSVAAANLDVTFEQLRAEYPPEIVIESDDERVVDTYEPQSYSESQTEEEVTQVSDENNKKTQNETIEMVERNYGTVAGRANQSIVGPPQATRVNASTVPLKSLNHYHSQRSKNINKVVVEMFEELCKPLYFELMRDQRVKLAYCKIKAYTLKEVSDKDMRYHRVLGQGAFGTVYGCMISHVGQMLAMKIMVKKKVKVKKARSQVKAEKMALRKLAEHPSPYSMQLRYAYQTAENFHLVIPLAVGGDLKYHLRGDKRLELDRARIYCAEIAYGLGHLHNLGMIMRDLKPRNVLLDSEGHCKISDFGLVSDISSGKPVQGRAGTEGYWAPEVINGLPYSIDADWWSYGCCVFELIAGFNPFSCKHTKHKTRNEGTRSGKIKYPSTFPSVAKPLVNALLNMDPTERLGCKGDGINEVMVQSTPFWKPLDLYAVKIGKGPVRWKPKPGNIYAVSQHEMLDNDDDANIG